MAPLQPGELVLVTGSNGYIGSHVVDQLLLKGFRVRGTVRTLEKSQWTQDLFDQKYGVGKYERVVVPDMAVPGAYDAAVQGIAGIAHLAAIIFPSSNPAEVITPVVDSTLALLRTAASSPSVKRFVLTSSSNAVTRPTANLDFSIDSNSYNEADLNVVKQLEQDIRDGKQVELTPTLARRIYAASKTLQEQALWRFVKGMREGLGERQMNVNVVVPNMTFGRLLHKTQADSSSVRLVTSLQGQTKLTPLHAAFPSQWTVNVVDVAKLHVSALMDADIVNERIFAFSQPFQFNDILAIARKMKPDDVWPDDIPSDGGNKMKVVERSRAEEILRKHYGHDFVGLEESLRDLFDSY